MIGTKSEKLVSPTTRAMAMMMGCTTYSVDNLVNLINGRQNSDPYFKELFTIFLLKCISGKLDLDQIGLLCKNTALLNLKKTDG